MDFSVIVEEHQKSPAHCGQLFLNRSPEPGIFACDNLPLPVTFTPSQFMIMIIDNNYNSRHPNMIKNKDIELFAVVFFFLIYLFIYFWLCWIFVAAHRLSLVVASGAYSSLRYVGFSLWWPLVAEQGSRHSSFNSCGTWAQ